MSIQAQYDPQGQLHLSTPSHSFWSGAAQGALFGAILCIVPRPVRNWMLTMLALTFAVILTIERPGYIDSATGEYYTGPLHRYPWYCIALAVVWCFWLVFGFIRAVILSRRLTAIGDTPVERFKARMARRVLIAIDGTQRPPQGPTGPSQRPTAPPPAPPMGSNLPATYAPTYSGPKRIETGLSGIVIRDYRGVDPEDL